MYLLIGTDSDGSSDFPLAIFSTRQAAKRYYMTAAEFALKGEPYSFESLLGNFQSCRIVRLPTNPAPPWKDAFEKALDDGLQTASDREIDKSPNRDPAGPSA